MTATLAPNPTCHACNGTGTDVAFGTECTECLRDAENAALLAARYEAAQGPAPQRRTGNGTGNGPARTNVATDRQVAFLAKLLNERQNAATIDAATPAGREALKAVEHAVENAGGMTKRTAGEFIDALLAIDVTTTAPARPAGRRANRYDAKCADCGLTVAPNDGWIEKLAARWITRHNECPQVETIDTEAGIERRGAIIDGLDLTTIPAGRYGVPGGDTRLKVRIAAPTTGKWAGWVFVKDGAEYGQERRYGKQRPGGTYVGDIEDELRAILADPLAAAKRYGELTERCCICNRKLEQEDSVAAGIGPVCATKFG